jgi:hypothetical protein
MERIETTVTIDVEQGVAHFLELSASPSCPSSIDNAGEEAVSYEYIVIIVI